MYRLHRLHCPHQLKYLSSTCLLGKGIMPHFQLYIALFFAILSSAMASALPVEFLSKTKHITISNQTLSGHDSNWDMFRAEDDFSSLYSNSDSSDYLSSYQSSDYSGYTSSDSYTTTNDYRSERYELIDLRLVNKGLMESFASLVIVLFGLIVAFLGLVSFLVTDKPQAKKTSADNNFNGDKAAINDVDDIANFKNKNLDVLVNLGEAYRLGVGVPQNCKKALEIFTMAAKRGNTEAICKLGMMYELGAGVPQDYRQAQKLYLTAARRGNTNAQCGLGHLYEFGKGTTQNYELARKCYVAAAKRGNARAQCSLGYLYETGHGVPQNYGQAVKLYKLSASQGLSNAQNNLGVCYLNGYGVTKDEKEAVHFLSLAA